MTIYYDSDETFYDGVIALVKRGTTFSASHPDLKITFLGGF